MSAWLGDPMICPLDPGKPLAAKLEAATKQLLLRASAKNQFLRVPAVHFLFELPLLRSPGTHRISFRFIREVLP